MKILVFAHQLELGGLVTLIELSAALRDVHGHDVVLFATPGPLSALVDEKRLRFVSAPPTRFHPSLARIRALRDVVRRERPDFIYVWEYYQCLEAYYVEHLVMRVPMAVTSMMMKVPNLLPKALPTTFGTPELVDRARAQGRSPVELLLPPVDIRLNAPEAVNPIPFREQCGIQRGDIVLVTVSRFSSANDIKIESLLRTVTAVAVLARDLPVRFVLVGDGPLRCDIERLAGDTNAKLGRAVVVLAGAQIDPRPAYAAADVFIGMGSSALRAMAFAKPAVIVGAQSFSAPFTPETARSFYYKGFYGVGDGSPDDTRLASQIRELVAHSERLTALGEFSRRFVSDHFALETVAAGLADFFDFAVSHQPRAHMAALDGLRTAALWARDRSWWE
jgi:L-malate glycosyltransferase